MTVLLTGATGFLGRYLVEELRRRGLSVVTAGRRDADLMLDLADPASLPGTVEKVEKLGKLGPCYLLNAAALSSMAACEKEPELAETVNSESARVLAQSGGYRFLQVSTDLVFAGDCAPYGASALPKPLSVYGRSKAGGEELSGGRGRCLVVRLPLLFGRSQDGHRGATDMLRSAVARQQAQAQTQTQTLTLYTNEYRTPLHVADAARGLVDLLLCEKATGIRHLGGFERVSRWELASRFARVCGMALDGVQPGESTDPKRPKDVSLIGDWQPGRDLDAALADC